MPDQSPTSEGPPRPVPDGSRTTSAVPPTASVPPAELPLLTLPTVTIDESRYEWRGELGRGGIGMVQRVYDRVLRRELAIKVLLDRHAGRPDLARRFLEEAQIASQLQHPGIAPVHELGALPDGRPYFAMKLVKGRTLAALLAERPDPVTDLPRFLGVFLQICQAVAYAHERAVIHRDLKPSNVMVGAFGEVQVMDWGLAKVLASDSSPDRGASDDAEPAGLPVTAIATLRDESPEAHSAAGAVLGTFAYMPPEQARGQAARLDRRADVFGLGAILCEILTGKPPYAGTAEELVYQAQLPYLAPAIERLDQSAGDPEVVRLAKRCLEPKAEDRPADATALAEAMGKHLAAAQERARQAELERTAAEVRTREERKRRRVTVLLALSAVVILALVGGGWVWQERQRQARLLDSINTANLALSQAQRLLDEAGQRPRPQSAQEAAELLAIWRRGRDAVEQAEEIIATRELDPGTYQRLADIKQSVDSGLAAADQSLANCRMAEVALLAIRTRGGKFDLGLAAGDSDTLFSEFERGIALRDEGLFDESLSAFKHGYKLIHSFMDRAQYQRWVDKAAHLVECNSTLEAFVGNGRRQATAIEKCSFAEVCLHKRMTHLAIQLYEEAFAEQPSLAEDFAAGHRFRAARAAASVGWGRGIDTTNVDQQERARLRLQARIWLQAEHEVWKTISNSDDKRIGGRDFPVFPVDWLHDRAFVGVRDRALLNALIPEEQKAWDDFWKQLPRKKWGSWGERKFWFIGQQI